MAENAELAVAWRDEQIEMLRAELAERDRKILDLRNVILMEQSARAYEAERADAAERALAILREEIDDACSGTGLALGQEVARRDEGAGGAGDA